MFNEKLTENKESEEEEKLSQWISNVEKSLKATAIEKSIKYNYNFILDEPMDASQGKWIWENENDLKKSPLLRSSSADARISSSTAGTFDFEDILESEQKSNANFDVLNRPQLNLSNSLNQPSQRFSIIQERGRLSF